MVPFMARSIRENQSKIQEELRAGYLSKRQKKLGNRWHFLKITLARHLNARSGTWLLRQDCGAYLKVISIQAWLGRIHDLLGVCAWSNIRAWKTPEPSSSAVLL